MSYSFTVKGKTRQAVVQAAGIELDNIAKQQPAHDADVGKAENAVDELLGVLVAPGEGESISASVSGSLSWRAEGEFTAASLNVNVSVVKD